MLKSLMTHLQNHMSLQGQKDVTVLSETESTDSYSTLTKSCYSGQMSHLTHFGFLMCHYGYKVLTHLIALLDSANICVGEVSFHA